VFVRLIRIFRIFVVIIVLAGFPPAALASVADEDRGIPTQEAGTGSEGISAVLPDSIPFDIVLPENGGEGFVNSEMFWISNDGPNAIGVTLSAVRLSISDTEAFSIADSENLPQEGNNIRLSLVCTQNGVSETYAVTDIPRTAHTFWLAGGEDASFRMCGAVNELGEKPWSETGVTISLCFAVVSLEEVVSDEAAELETLPEDVLDPTDVPAETATESELETLPEEVADPANMPAETSADPKIDALPEYPPESEASTEDTAKPETETRRTDDAADAVEQRTPVDDAVEADILNEGGMRES
jgi:hypothetical protein